MGAAAVVFWNAHKGIGRLKIKQAHKMEEWNVSQWIRLTAAEICKEIEDFILELQQKTTLPQRFSVEELTEQGAI